VFYEKLPFYDLSSHQHKFVKSKPVKSKNVSMIEKQDCYVKNKTNDDLREGFRDSKYDPPLPTSVVKEESKMVVPDSDLYGGAPREDNKECGGHQQRYDPPLPVSVVKEEVKTINTLYQDEVEVPDYVNKRNKETGMSAYEPPLPTSMLEVKSTRGKHSTEKPVALMEWILKYYSKEGDVVLDPTMGSGSTGVSCKNMNRNFIGIEKDEEIFQVACERLEKCV